MKTEYKNFIQFDSTQRTYRYKNDIKYHMLGKDKSQIINLPHGYSFNIPATQFEADYTYSELRCKYFFDDCVLTTSFEDKNPYVEGNKYSSASGKRGWEIYLDEWIVRYISHDEYLTSNNILKVKENIHSFDFLGKYELINFSYFSATCASKNIP